jgi:HupE/UreJ protein
MTLQALSSRLLVCWIVGLVLAAIPLSAVAHPLHSEAIERPCNLHQKDDPVSLIEARCSFFVAAGYLVFKLDAPSGSQEAQTRTISGAINLTQSTGSVFVSDGAELANGAVKLAERSPQAIHMKPGALAIWDNGYVLEVSGTPTAADGAVGMVAQQNTETVGEVVRNYLELGFLHIIPRGFDHILFVIGLFLLSPRHKELLWQISAFTVAHTLTLALGATGVVSLPATIVEPLIALSIVWVGVENLLTNKLHRWRIGVVFGFGLLHGLGFAGVLLDIGLTGTHFYSALLSFNLGVELGQLAVITLCFLAVGWAREHSDYHRRVVVPASYAIAIIAAYWVVQRTGLINIATN